MRDIALCGVSFLLEMHNTQINYNMKRKGFISVITLICLILSGCGGRHSASSDVDIEATLTDSITKIISAYPGEIGVAVIINNTDTVTVNDYSIYPMMSVFKLHQAIALCDYFDRFKMPLDSVISVSRNTLDSVTWSPMLKDYTESVISITVRDLLRYSLSQSDNNASNLLFKKFVNVNTTDSIISTLIPDNTFQIACTEEEMSADHAKAYSNYTSPSGAAMLINRLFNEKVIGEEKQEFIKKTLAECTTGKDRIVAPLLDNDSIFVAHKTGSGYMANGILAAHNDVAYIILPNGVSYSLSVFVKDFNGKETEASEVIARISAMVYKLLSESSDKPNYP